MISELKVHWNDEWIDKYVRSLGERIKQKKSVELKNTIDQMNNKHED